MSDVAANFKTTYIELVEKTAAAGVVPVPGSHLTPQQLTDFQNDDLSEQEYQHLQEHLLECRDCFEIWRDMRSFAAAPTTQAGREGRSSSSEVASLLRMCRRQPLGSRVSKRLTPLALAASLVAAAGLAGLVAVQQRKIGELSGRVGPFANPAIVELAEAPSRRGGRADQPPGIMAEAGLLLLLTPPKLAECSEYQVRIIDSEGTVVHILRGLEKNPRDDSFSLWLPPGSLVAGELRVELHGVEAGGEKLLAAYHLLVQGRD